MGPLPKSTRHGRVLMVEYAPPTRGASKSRLRRSVNNDTFRPKRRTTRFARDHGSSGLLAQPPEATCQIVGVGATTLKVVE
jgi:hypothetical protein